MVDETCNMTNLKKQVLELIQPKVGFAEDLDPRLLQIREYPRIKNPGILMDHQNSGNSENSNDKYPGKVLTDQKSNMKKQKIQVAHLFISLLREVPNYQKDT